MPKYTHDTEISQNFKRRIPPYYNRSLSDPPFTLCSNICEPQASHKILSDSPQAIAI